MGENYIEIMIQSLEKKIRVLDGIIDLNREQKILLENPSLGPEEFEQNVKRKGQKIEELDFLDEGFQQLYDRVKEELDENRERYASQIRRMQDLIREISAKSASIQTQEARNKTLAEQKFASVRKQVKQVRNGQKIVKQYYDNMKKTYHTDPQFLDNKK